MRAGSVYTGVEFSKRLCGISVIRSGESMENALRACCKGIKIGKILIHREGDNGKQLIYHNLPKDIANRHVLLLDPILGTGMLMILTYPSCCYMNFVLVLTGALLPPPISCKREQTNVGILYFCNKISLANCPFSNYFTCHL
jgi:hypothetical protein